MQVVMERWPKRKSMKAGRPLLLSSDVQDCEQVEGPILSRSKEHELNNLGSKEEIE
jgi:hypothetical protein